MSEEQKKATVKAIAKNEIAVKPVKHVLAKHVPAKVPLNVFLPNKFQQFMF